MDLTKKNIGLAYTPTDLRNRDFINPSEVLPLARDEIILTCDSNDKVGGSAYDFRINCKVFITEPRRISVSALQMAQIPQINQMNMNVSCTYNNTIYNFIFKPGFYDQDSFVNQLMYELQSAVSNQITCLYDPIQNTCEIKSDKNFGFLSCPFITYGQYVHGFQVQNPSLITYSGNMELLYTHYIVVKSSILNKWTRMPNMTSRAAGNVIAVFPIDLNDSLNKAALCMNPNPNFISTLTLGDITDIDFQIEDEFGNNLQYVMPSFMSNAKTMLMVRIQL